MTDERVSVEEQIRWSTHELNGEPDSPFANGHKRRMRWTAILASLRRLELLERVAEAARHVILPDSYDGGGERLLQALAALDRSAP